MRTVWTLFNAVTEAALKNTAMESMARRTTALHEYAGKLTDYVLKRNDPQPIEILTRVG